MMRTTRTLLRLEFDGSVTTLIVNLLGQPEAIAEKLEGLKSEAGKELIPDIFATEPYFVEPNWLAVH